MHEAGFGADMLAQIGQKGDDVVLGLALDLVDPRDLPTAARPDRLGGGFRDGAQGGLRVAGMGFDLEPDPETVLRRPDRDHGRTTVAGNHRGDARKIRENRAIDSIRLVSCPTPRA